MGEARRKRLAAIARGEEDPVVLAKAAAARAAARVEARRMEPVVARGDDKFFVVPAAFATADAIDIKDALAILARKRRR